MPPPYRIDAADRAWFKRCRRAWDLGATARQALAPARAAVPAGLAAAFRDALDVYYFPGTWQWDRAIVLPLAHQALDRRRLPGSSAALGHRLLDRYATWAPAVDDFDPVQVATDFVVNVPDPLLSDRDVSTEDGTAVVYAAHLDAVVFAAPDDRPWVMLHRIGPFAAFADQSYLALDEEPLTLCWAWGHYTLDGRVGGVAVNEVRLDDVDEPFRRTVLPMDGRELALAGRQLGREALDMLDAGLQPYPNPTPDGCGVCPFRGPCLAMRQGRDHVAALSRGYRQRPGPPPLTEGRLGAPTWSVGRGARPPRL